MPKVIHFEIPATDPQKLQTFYSKVFGWTYQEMPGQSYWFTNGGPNSEEGINGAIMQRRDPAQPVTVTINVTDLAGSLASIEKAGGTVVVQPVAIPGMGSFAFFKDPDGNIVGCWEHVKKQA